jgi:hypothetical protein
MNIGDGRQKIPFFQKPGSVTGTILLGLGGVFLLLHLNSILTFLNSLLANTITFIGLCCALAAIVYCILDPKIRTIISELYFMIVRKVMGLVVDMDPISIVKHHLEKMREKITEIQKNMGSLRGLIKESERILEAKRNDLERNIKLGQKAREKNSSQQEIQVYDRQAVRLDGTIQRQEKRLADAKKWYNILSDLKKAAELTVQDTENEVNERIEEWNMIKKQHKVFTSVMSILSQNDKMGTFTMAMDKMSYDITQRLGEMEDIIDETGGILSYISTDNELTSDKASELISKYEKYGIDGFFGNYQDYVEVKESKPVAYIENNGYSEIILPQQPMKVRIDNNEDKYETAEPKVVEAKWFD